MPISPGSDIKYLKQLQPDRNLQIWLGVFQNSGVWSKANCKEFYYHILTTPNSKNKNAVIKTAKTNYSNINNTQTEEVNALRTKKKI